MSLTLGDDGSWHVLDARDEKRVGELNPDHFEDGELLTLIRRLLPIG